MFGQHVPVPTGATEHIPLTPTASVAVDMKTTANFNDRVMNDNGEPWATETDHRTGRNKEFKSETHRDMLYGIALRDYPKQAVALAKVKSVPKHMREFLSWAHRHHRIDVTASTVERKTGGPASVGMCPGGCKEFSRKDPNAHCIRLTCKICGTVRKDVRRPQRQDPATCSDRQTDHREGNAHTRERCLVLIVGLTLIPFRVRSSTLSKQHFQKLRIVMKS